jgi:hypothetical protein
LYTLRALSFSLRKRLLTPNERLFTPFKIDLGGLYLLSSLYKLLLELFFTPGLRSFPLPLRQLFPLSSLLLGELLLSFFGFSFLAILAQYVPKYLLILTRRVPVFSHNPGYVFVHLLL